MYTYISMLLGMNHRLRTNRTYPKTTITIHSTGNPNSTAENERKWLDNPENKRDASYHYVCGEGKVICALPENEEAWHCSVTEGNRHSIAIEIIESGDRQKVLMTAVEFVADTLKRYGWGTDKLKTHHDWNGKNCPRILIDPKYIKNNLNWAWFIKTIEEFLKAGQEEPKPKKEKIIINGVEKYAECVNIGGHTYWKIRDIAPEMGFYVGNSGKTPVLVKM